MNEFLAGVESRAYRMARAAIWDHELALDIVQDSMLRLVEHYRERPAAEWPPLFFRILHNRINDAKRWRMVHGAKRLLFSMFQGPSDNTSSSPADEIVDRIRPPTHDVLSEQESKVRDSELRQAIERAVTMLPRRQREVFTLREWQEFTVEETAEIIGCSAGTVKQHHFRALRALRKLLAEVWEDA